MGMPLIRLRVAQSRSVSSKMALDGYFSATAPRDMFEFMRKCAPRAIYLYDRQSPAVQGKIDQALRDEGAKATAFHAGKIPCPALLVSGAKTKA
jgi:hypothetical protein